MRGRLLSRIDMRLLVWSGVAHSASKALWDRDLMLVNSLASFELSFLHFSSSARRNRITKYHMERSIRYPWCIIFVQFSFLFSFGILMSFLWWIPDTLSICWNRTAMMYMICFMIVRGLGGCNDEMNDGKMRGMQTTYQHHTFSCQFYILLPSSPYSLQLKPESGYFG